MLKNCATKSILYAGLLLMMQAQQIYAYNIDEIKQVLTSANTRTFSKDNLMVVRISAEDESKWKEALEITRKFVADNQTLLKLTTPLVDYLIPVTSASNEIFNALNSSYYNCVRPGIIEPAKKDTGLSVLEGELVSFSEQVSAAAVSASCIESKINGLKGMRDNLSKSFESLKNKIVILSSQDAREAIYFANFIMRQTIDKIFRDYEKMKGRIGRQNPRFC